MKIVPITLEGRHVVLAPMEMSHHAALCEVGLDEDLWKWTGGHIPTAEGMRAYMERAIERENAIPFVVSSKVDDKIVGSTRFGNIDKIHRRVEIGWTWYAKPWQRAVVNTESKYLLLRHAFETLDCVRVEFKTDARNEPSRNAILRIGAKQEGILRQHMINSRGHLRDTVYFSIVDREWPDVKAALEEKLARPY